MYYTSEGKQGHVTYEDVDVKVNTSGTAGHGKLSCISWLNGYAHVLGIYGYNIHYCTAGDKQDVSYDYIHVKGNETVYSGGLKQTYTLIHSDWTPCNVYIRQDSRLSICLCD